jgi:hypothetical protein
MSGRCKVTAFEGQEEARMKESSRVSASASASAAILPTVPGYRRKSPAAVVFYQKNATKNGKGHKRHITADSNSLRDLERA